MPGITRLSLLKAQLRVELDLAGAPASFGIKVYEDPRGRCEAIPSHIPTPRRPGSGKTLTPARPMPTSPSLAAKTGPRGLTARANDPLSNRADFRAVDQPTTEAALERTLELILTTAKGLQGVDWLENPDF